MFLFRMPNGIAGLHISAYYTDILQAPWCQAAGYLIGMAVGYVLYKCKCKMHINRVSKTKHYCIEIFKFKYLFILLISYTNV